MGAKNSTERTLKNLEKIKKIKYDINNIYNKDGS